MPRLPSGARMMIGVTCPDPSEPSPRAEPGDAEHRDAERDDRYDRDALLHELSALTLPMMWTLRQAAVRALEPLGIRPIKGLVLGLVANGTTSPKELTELLDTAAPMMSSLLADLEERGLIVREADPGDRRRVRIRPTAEGIVMTERITDFWVEAGRERLHGLSDDDLRHLITVYRTIVGTP